MPTGYTSKLYEGEDQTFEEFALQCAHAFIIDMRDSSMDAPIPEKANLSEYHWLQFLKAVDGLNEALARDIGDWAALELSSREEHNTSQLESIATRKARGTRYADMLTQVQAWNPPTEKHQGIKDFMIEQLESSIKFDCSTSYSEPMEPRKTVDYRDAQIGSAIKDVTYHWKHWLEDVERANSNTAWIEAFRSSVVGVGKEGTE